MRSVHYTFVTLAALGLFVAGPGLVAQSQNQPPASTPPAPAQTGSQPAPANAEPDAAPNTGPDTKPAAKKPAPANDNAFPEAESEAAQKQANEDERSDRDAAKAGPAADPDAPAESSSSSREKLRGMDVLGDRESRISNGDGGTIVDPKLSLKDLHVGQQYMGMGDYEGAYQRFKEACAVNPSNLDAVFYLAEAARKTAHLDESAQNYRIYLEAQPDGSKAKQARKALAQLSGK